VRDVGAVEALALHDERLGPDGFFRRAELHRNAKDFLLDGVLEPAVVDFGDAVAGVENDVNEVLAVMRFGEPMVEGDLGLEAAAREGVKHAPYIAQHSGEIWEIAHFHERGFSPAQIRRLYGNCTRMIQEELASNGRSAEIKKTLFQDLTTFC